MTLFRVQVAPATADCLTILRRLPFLTERSLRWNLERSLALRSHHGQRLLGLRSSVRRMERHLAERFLLLKKRDQAESLLYPDDLVVELAREQGGSHLHALDYHGLRSLLLASGSPRPRMVHQLVTPVWD